MPASRLSGRSPPLPGSRRRLLRVAAGGGGAKQPFHIRRKNRGPVAFAGLWDRWEDPGAGGGVLESCTILSTDAKPLLRPLHERMPVILEPEHYALWLDRQKRDGQALRDLLCPYRRDDLEAVPVSTYVNNVRNEGPGCLEAPR